MKRALLIGNTSTNYLFFLKILAEREKPYFQAKRTEFDGVLFLTADVVDNDLILDVSGKKLECLGNNVYKAEGNWKPELPQEQKGFKNQKEPLPDSIKELPGDQSVIAVMASKKL